MLFALLLTGTLFTYCSKNNDAPTDENSIEYFNANMKADLKYADIVNIFGEPDGDMGSGIHIYYYNLNDGSKVYIGYADKILYVRHVNSGGLVIHTLI